ncbi:hypothetical protein [Metamycoplasma hyosynoviae]|uniref:hypothetical protein n=1 Tax=Metamycoplasma hyosynoviae TaxID=29559 RepID=UPI0004610F8D|nr:hypothetical protein [Metamycoplasma hyosynoviae]KDE45285.1 hypothetical protein NPL4_01610 [Metamycoplasma hyosynoviae]MDC8919258.1 hypothetical protein [Metamycoplasma hyosynoviae]MDC8919672.1 hypothetical protein [Metamycoplasma hyosynoviae]MDC8921013.1 hypothetical protein [Metamycoplasma hyosynoviae]MDC8921717.1 hypothetical protein [Metamycoplasma hyosynoviae]
MKITNKPPKFTEEKLRQLLHYTDQEANPTYEAYKSNSFYKIYSGAKGVSKSFSRMIETIYRVVNENNFCSVWCRNQFNHIRNTLRPMLEKVLYYLAEEHNLDFRDYFYVTNEAAYWRYEDGGIDRAIYFQNWEKIQAFQGFTLKNSNFRFGELVIDEPLEDTADSNKLPHELEEIYALQEEKLPLLIANTVLREVSPNGFRINVTFLYNIFTTNHFLIKNYHQEAIKILEEDNLINQKVLNELLENHYLQKENTEFSNGLGIIVTMFSKYFIPKKYFSEIQEKNLDLLKETNYRLWVITVIGYAFNFEDTKLNYFMKNIIFDEEGNVRKKIKTISKNKFHKYLSNGEILGIYHGYDPGIHDNAAFVTVALHKDGRIIVLKVIEDIKLLIPKNTIWKNKAINEKITQIINKQNKEIEKYLPYGYSSKNFLYSKTSVLFCDNHASIEALNLLFEENKINCFAIKAVRKPTQQFGIVDRQMWQKNIFENNLINFLPNNEILLKCLAKQVVIKDSTKPLDAIEKRDESINPEIYDVINAFEMSSSLLFRYQYALIYEKLENEGEI